VAIEVTGGFAGRRAPDPGIASSEQAFARRLGRAIPPVRPSKPYSRVSTIGETAGTPLGRLLRAVVLRMGGYHTAEDPTTAKMIERSVDEMPLRTIALFSQGRVNLGMVDGLVDLLNGRPDRSAVRIVRGLARSLPIVGR
jgi:beta-glucosidase